MVILFQSTLALQPDTGCRATVEATELVHCCIMLCGLQVDEEPLAVPRDRQTLSVIRQFLERQFTTTATRRSIVASAANLRESARASRALLPGGSPQDTQLEPPVLATEQDDCSLNHEGSQAQHVINYGALTVCSVYLCTSLKFTGEQWEVEPQIRHQEQSTTIVCNLNVLQAQLFSSQHGLFYL